MLFYYVEDSFYLWPERTESTPMLDEIGLVDEFGEPGMARYEVFASEPKATEPTSDERADLNYSRFAVWATTDPSAAVSRDKEQDSFDVPAEQVYLNSDTEGMVGEVGMYLTLDEMRDLTNSIRGLFFSTYDGSTQEPRNEPSESATAEQRGQSVPGGQYEAIGATLLYCRQILDLKGG
jgi:hypothetical protein